MKHPRETEAEANRKLHESVMKTEKVKYDKKNLEDV